MLFAVRIVTVLFLFFLATPTLVSAIKKNSDTCCFFNAAEEEIAHKSFNEVKGEMPPVVQILLNVWPTSGERSHFLHTHSDYLAFEASIHLPPPEHI